MLVKEWYSLEWVVVKCKECIIDGMVSVNLKRMCVEEECVHRWLCFVECVVRKNKEWCCRVIEEILVCCMGEAYDECW